MIGRFTDERPRFVVESGVEVEEPAVVVVIVIWVVF